MASYFSSLTDAREHAARVIAAGQPIKSIIEIDHVDGRRFFCCLAPMAVFARHLAGKPMADIVRLIAEHDPMDAAGRAVADAKEAATKAAYLRGNIRCERCLEKIDGNTAYKQREWCNGVRCLAYYCDRCKNLLQSIGDGETSDLQHRATTKLSREPAYKGDFDE